MEKKLNYPDQTAINSYFNDIEYVSQSKLKKVIGGLDYYMQSLKDEKTLYYEEKGHFIIGSGVDTLLTMGKGPFDELFYISVVDKPSNAIMSIMKLVYDEMIAEFNSELQPIGATHPELEELADNIYDACEVHNYQPRWGKSAKVNAVIKDGKAYYDDLVSAGDKQIISFEENAIIIKVVESFKEHKDTKMLFTEANDTDKNIEIYYQYPIYQIIRGIKCKGLLDIIIINHTDKLIRIIDIKTTGDSVINFSKSVKRFRYDFQAAFYTELLRQYLNNPDAGLYHLRDYQIVQFRFLVESTTFTGNPCYYQCADELIQIGTRGRDEYGLQLPNDNPPLMFNAIHGFIYALDVWKYYLGNGFDKDYQFKSGNVLPLNW